MNHKSAWKTTIFLFKIWFSLVNSNVSPGKCLANQPRNRYLSRKSARNPHFYHGNWSRNILEFAWKLIRSRYYQIFSCFYLAIFTRQVQFQLNKNSYHVDLSIQILFWQIIRWKRAEILKTRRKGTEYSTLFLKSINLRILKRMKMAAYIGPMVQWKLFGLQRVEKMPLSNFFCIHSIKSKVGTKCDWRFFVLFLS